MANDPVDGFKMIPQQCNEMIPLSGIPVEINLFPCLGTVDLRKVVLVLASCSSSQLAAEVMALWWVVAAR